LTLIAITMRVTISSVDRQVLVGYIFLCPLTYLWLKGGKKKDWLGVTPFLKKQRKRKSASIPSTFLKVEEGGSHFYWHDCMKWTWGSPFQGFLKNPIYFIKAYIINSLKHFLKKILSILAKNLKHRKKFTTQNVYVGFFVQ
jgi:hypothetical protein